MIGWLRHHGSALASAVAQIGRHPLGSLLTAVVIGIALALPAAGLTLLDNAGRAVGEATGRPEISLFLDAGASADQLREIERRLRAEGRLAGFRFVARDAALAQLAADGLEDVVRDLPANPLPDAFVASPLGEDPAVFEALRSEFARWPAVAHVQLDSAWVKRLHALLELGRETVLLLAALLASALMIVTFNTIRLQLLTQRTEIEVSRLLGASDGFIRRPFLWLGALQGLLGGSVAWGLVEGLLAALAAPVTHLAQTYGAVFALQRPQPSEIAALLAFAAALGLIGASLSVGRHLRTAR